METQSAYDTNITHQHGEGEDDQHHEKQSVLKKVKAKAKKIKDTIKKHGPGHHHEGHTHIPDDHDLDEEDDDDEEEIVQDPEVHGAPMYESAAAKNVVSGQPEEVSRPGITNFDRSDALPTHPLASENYYTGNHGTKDNDPPNSTFSAHGAPMYESAAAKNVAPGQPEDLSRPGITDFETPKALPTDPLASRERSENYYTGKYETKHNDPPHSAVSGLEAPLGREQPRVDFGKTTATVEEPLAPQNTPLPSSYQVKEDNPTKTFVHGGDEYNPGQQKVNLQRPKGLEEDDAAPKDSFEPYTTTNYQTKVTDSTGQGGEATGIAPLLHSMDKMKIYDEQGTGRGPNLPSATQARASDLAFSTGTHDQFSPEPTPQEPTHNVDKPSNQSSYTEKISSATSAIADKAVSAKNIVASKLGYGEKNQAQFQSPTTAGAGSTVMSKIHGPGSGTATEVETEQHVQDQDKGVSVKSYIADKFKPGEEDRALSEVISEALQKRKEESPEAEKETRARGKVTESEEVARRLGTGDETTERAGSGSMNSPTQSVVDKLKGAVGSWFGKPEGPQGTQQAHSASYADNADSSADGRTLQESGN
ncbi:LOW-TEMPERATURE-INDUCED 65, RESPONSIVE TO DESICCATION 29B [Hibiscus trionum]|uniref:LOW-TEMPERATURE-INDUCED 65, RESPONSIVE TO DESICCATION 29B n=1 Tax=Hibiscus trionum TaxID=183268 RepID=A0A9W7INZ3_HIBTR|nr:LOW-TEMPERATURE-INDUCED 65, RESPONSIVE TO DESICCATION 29B [Hibiscus trionum]